MSTLIKFTSWLSSEKPAKTTMPRRSFLGLGALAASVVILPRCAEPDNTWMHYEQGVHLYNGRYYQEAVQELSLYNNAYLDALAKKDYFDPESAKYSLYLTAKIYDKKLEQYPEAAESYQLALDCFPDATSAEKSTFRLGDIYYKQLNEYELAVEQYEIYLERFSYKAKDAAQAVVNIAAIYEHDLKDPIKAIEAYQRFIKYFSGDSAVTFCFGKIIKLSEELGDYGRVAAVLEEYLNYCQNEAEAEDIILQLIDIYENILQDYKSAVEMRKYYISRFPGSDKNGPMQYKIADTYREKLHDYEQAIKEYFALKAYSDYTPFFIYFAVHNIYLNDLHQLDKAVETLQILMGKYPDAPHVIADSQYNIGEAYERFQEFEKAAKNYYSFSVTVYNELMDYAAVYNKKITHVTEFLTWYCSNYECDSMWEAQ